MFKTRLPNRKAFSDSYGVEISNKTDGDDGGNNNIYRKSQKNK